MKKKIYVLATSPSIDDMRALLVNLKPPMSEILQERVLDSFSSIQKRLLSIPVNQSNYHFSQSQTFNDAHHTITLKGLQKEPTFIQKLLGIF